MDINQEIEVIFNTYSEEQRGSIPRYPFAWVLANQIVQQYYVPYGLDAISMVVGGIPSYALKITGERSCALQKRGQQTLGSIQFASGSVDNWRKLDNTRYEFAKDILTNQISPEAAAAKAFNHLEIEQAVENMQGDHSLCKHTFLAPTYPKLFQLITNLITEHASFTAEREVWVDVSPDYSEFHEKPFHPLRQLGLAEAGPNYDFFGLKNNESGKSLYVDINTSNIVAHPSSKTGWVLLPASDWHNLDEAAAAKFLLNLL